MGRKLVLLTALIIVLAGTLGFRFDFQGVEAGGTIYILANGDVEGTDKIERVGEYGYIFTDNINDSIVVQRSNITINGKGCTLQGFGNGCGFNLTGLSNVTIGNTIVKGFEHGVYLDSTSDSVVFGNKITNNTYGVYLFLYSSNDSVYGNNITANDWIGILLGPYSNNNSIYGNNIITNGNSIGLHPDSSNNSVYENNITSSHYGIGIGGSYHNVSENNITNNEVGIYLSFCFGSKFRNNVVANNTFGFGITVLGGISELINDIDTSNTVDGKPVYYWVNRHNETIPSDAGFIGLVNCTNITIKDQHVTNNCDGVLLAYTNNSCIEKSNFSNNLFGIYLYHSSGNTICDNHVMKNGWAGIGLEVFSQNNSVFGNDVTDNSQYGVYLMDAFGNKIFHNNFVNNTIQTNARRYTNTWDDGYPCGGNYWSDFNGTDSDYDGIADNQYEIDSYNIDHYPLMGPFSRFNTTLGYYVNVVSNSTIEDFTYFESNRTIKMYVSNMTGNQTYGFCRVCIPHALMDVSNISVIVDDGAVEVLHFNDTIYDNETHRWIYFANQHSIHEIIIIPELPSFLILPLFMIATLLAVTVYRRKHSDYM